VNSAAMSVAGETLTPTRMLSGRWARAARPIADGPHLEIHPQPDVPCVSEHGLRRFTRGEPGERLEPDHSAAVELDEGLEDHLQPGRIIKQRRELVTPLTGCALIGVEGVEVLAGHRRHHAQGLEVPLVERHSR
jgi:hypothetical protein